MNPSPRSDPARVETTHDEADSPADLALAEYMLRVDRGETVDRRAFLEAHPEAAAELAEYFTGSTSLEKLVDSVSVQFGPEMAPALEPIRELARQTALEEESGEHPSMEPATVVLVEEGGPAGGVKDDSRPVRRGPTVAGWWWGAAAVLCLGLSLAMFFRARGTGAGEQGDSYDSELPPRQFVDEDVKWVPAGPVLTVFDEQDRFGSPALRDGGLEIITEQAFAGRKAIRIGQTVHCEGVAALPARIRDRPVTGEYRYLRFAWKKPGGGPIALVLWGQAPNRRFHYFAGTRIGPEETVRTIRLGDSPREWTLVERDLFADFGQHNITAITLITQGDEPAFFDAIRLTANKPPAAAVGTSPAVQKKAAAPK